MITIDFDAKKGKGFFSGPCFPELREFFSIQNPAAKFNKSFYTPKRLYAFNHEGYFGIGLIDEIKNFLVSKQIKDTITLSDAAKAELYPSIGKPLIKRLSKEFRDYQEESLNIALEKGRGVFLLGTGAGKTLICAGLIDNFYLYSKDLSKFKTLIIVPDLGLVNQTSSDFDEYGVSFKYTKWTGSIEPDLSANVIIANSSILLSRFEQNKWIRDVDLLVVDEAHKLSHGSKICKIIDKIKTPNKFGLTGTLPENNIDKWNLIGKIGPILMQKSSYELRSEKFLTNAQVKLFNINYKTKPSYTSVDFSTTEKYQSELEFLKTNSFRNKILSKTCESFQNNILILINNIDHGEFLFKKLSDDLKDKKVFFIQGSVEVEERDKVKKIMESDNNVVCIAISSIFSTGINIKNIHMIIFAAGGKSFVRVVQSIGRGLRLNENKSKLYIIDIADNLKYGREHANKRREIYSSEKIVFTEHNITEN